MIEIKSTRTFSLEKTREKIDKSLVASREYNIELWILDKNGNILEKKL
jgi:hypothetical protein